MKISNNRELSVVLHHSLITAVELTAIYNSKSIKKHLGWMKQTTYLEIFIDARDNLLYHSLDRD